MVSQEALRIIRDELISWDPHSLISMGAPLDEFDSQAQALEPQLTEVQSAAEAAKLISRVFSETFFEGDFPVEKCSGVGAVIFTRLKNANLLIER